MHDVMLPPAGYDFFNYNPVWSLDSKQLAFLSQDLDIWGEPVAFLGKINLDGSKFETRPDWRLHDNAIAWSPDGKGIVFSSDKDGDNDLYLTDGNLTSAHKIFITTADEDYEFFYISDDQIVLRSNLKINNPEGDYEIFLVEPEQSFIDNLTRNEIDETYVGGVSPDQSKLLFGNGDVMLFDLEQHELVNLTNSPKINESRAIWTPGGDIIYVSGNTIFTMDTNGDNKRAIAVRMNVIEDTLK